MPAVAPEFYSTLEPFRERFRAGTAVLMYHKVGLRPKRALYRALYVSPRLFALQMRELRESGFQAVSLGRMLEPAAPPSSFVITFDDGFSNVLENAAPVLADSGWKAIQFIVANLLGGRNEWDVRDGEAPERLMDAVEIREWLAAGHEIGSHTLTHCRLGRLSLRDASEEISASKKRLEDLFGAPVRHFCYPYGEAGLAVQDLVLEAGYETACTTQSGVNRPDTPRFALRRFLARHPSRRVTTLREGLELLRLR